MPKYINNSDKTIYLTYDNTYLKPGDTIETLHFYRIDGLDMISAVPYVFPIDIINRETLSDDTVKEYDIYDAAEVIINVKSGNIIISPNEDFNSDTHTEYTLYEGMSFKMHNKQKYIEKLYVKKDPNVKQATYEIIIKNEFSFVF